MELDPVRIRLLRVISDHDTNLAVVSKAIGRNHAYLQQFVRRATPRTLSEEVRAALSRYFQVPPDFFRSTAISSYSDGEFGSGNAVTSAADFTNHHYFAARGSPPPELRSDQPGASGFLDTPGGDSRAWRNNDVIEISGRQFALVGVFDIRASAGYGTFNESPSNALFYQPFAIEWLRTVTTSPSTQLAVIKVAGDSMSDTLYHGDHVLVDRSVKRIGRDGIYVVRIQQDELMVKRCARSARTKLLTIISDNPLYPTEHGVRDRDIEVEGQVIWLGRNISG